MAAVLKIHPIRDGLAGEALVPYSKPHMQRAILLSLLTNGPSIIAHPAWSSETRLLFESAERFGLTVNQSDAHRLVVTGVGRSFAPRGAALRTEGSAFNMRALAALACLSADETIIEASASMRRRPVLEHLAFVRDLGGRLDDLSDERALRIRVRGGRRVGGETTVDTSHSSQVLTAALLVAPLADSEVAIRCADAALVAGGYVDLTLAMMREQGVAVQRTASGLHVSPGPYESRLHFMASDFTALSYLVAAVAVAPTADVSVADYHPSELTCEADFLRAAAALGVRTDYDPVARRLRIRRGEASGHVEIDARNIPTVVPTLAAIAPFVDARVTVRNAAHVNNHKCRRVDVMIRELRRMGCVIDPVLNAAGDVDGFQTVGRQAPAGGVALQSHGDHRIFMSLAVAASGARSPVTVDGARHLHASFPSFLEVMGGLGVQASTAVPQPAAMTPRRRAALHEYSYPTRTLAAGEQP